MQDYRSCKHSLYVGTVFFKSPSYDKSMFPPPQFCLSAFFFFSPVRVCVFSSRESFSVQLWPLFIILCKLQSDEIVFLFTLLVEKARIGFANCPYGKRHTFWRSNSTSFATISLCGCCVETRDVLLDLVPDKEILSREHGSLFTSHNAKTQVERRCNYRIGEKILLQLLEFTCDRTVI